MKVKSLGGSCPGCLLFILVITLFTFTNSSRPCTKPLYFYEIRCFLDSSDHSLHFSDSAVLCDNFKFFKILSILHGRLVDGCSFLNSVSKLLDVLAWARPSLSVQWDFI